MSTVRSLMVKLSMLATKIKIILTVLDFSVTVSYLVGRPCISENSRKICNLQKFKKRKRKPITNFYSCWTVQNVTTGIPAVVVKVKVLFPIKEAIVIALPLTREHPLKALIITVEKQFKRT